VTEEEHMNRQLDMHHGGDMAAESGEIDPVCGMSVEPETARARGLAWTYEDKEYFFCGRGCKLDFMEDPTKYLAADYQPQM
jgi:Cu+-exporting ATPase